MFLWKRPLDTVLHYGQVLTKLRLCPKWEKSNGPVIDQNVSSIFLSRITQKSGYIADYSQKTVGSFAEANMAIYTSLNFNMLYALFTTIPPKLKESLFALHHNDYVVENH